MQIGLFSISLIYSFIHLLYSLVSKLRVTEVSWRLMLQSLGEYLINLYLNLFLLNSFSVQLSI